MLNFNQLRVFYYAAKYLNFTEAACALYITQPAVTAQIKALESYCGLKLFKKRGRHKYLSEEGKTLFTYAETIFSCEKDIENTLEDLRQLKRGVLRIGTTTAYARYFMPLMLSTFHYKYPKIKIEMSEGSSLEMTLSLLDFKNEVAVIAGAGEISGIEFIPFSKEEMVVLVPPQHPLTKKKAIYFHELKDEPFIMKDKGSGTRKLVDRLFSQSHCQPNILMEVSNSEFIKQLVQRGDGVSFLVHEVVAMELAQGLVASVPLKGEKIYLDVSIAYLAKQHLSPAAKAFVDTLKQLRSGRAMRPEGIGKYMARILAQQREI